MIPNSEYLAIIFSVDLFVPLWMVLLLPRLREIYWYRLVKASCVNLLHTWTAFIGMKQFELDLAFEVVWGLWPTFIPVYASLSLSKGKDINTQAVT